LALGGPLGLLALVVGPESVVATRNEGADGLDLQSSESVVLEGLEGEGTMGSIRAYMARA
jgi:hypothetical protein